LKDPHLTVGVFRILRTLRFAGCVAVGGSTRAAGVGAASISRGVLAQSCYTL